METQSNTTQRKSTGTSFLKLLTLLFIALKLTGHIGSSWWWVTAPLWGVPVVILTVYLTALAGLLMWSMTEDIFRAMNKK